MPDFLGKHGVEKLYANRQQVLEICSDHQLHTMNNYNFVGSFLNKVGWR